jgi:hypothetical protein
LKVAIGFKKIQSLTYSVGDVKFLNAFFLINHSTDFSLENLLDQFLEEINIDKDEFIVPIGLLNNELILNEGMKEIEHAQLDLIKLIITDLHFRLEKIRKIDWIHEDFSSANFDEKKLFLRYGNVELRALEFAMRNPSLMPGITENLITNINDTNFIYKQMQPGAERWLFAGDGNFNIKALMSNAGFYFSLDPNKAQRDLSAWTEKYFQGFLVPGCQLFPYPACYPFFLNVWKELSDSKQSYIPLYSHFPSPSKFFSMLRGKRVLVLTPFKDLMVRMVNENRLRNLYKNFEISETNFVFCQSPVSLYPTRPGDGWLDTFDNLASEISSLISRHDIDIFFASCGSYGVPITSHIYNEFNITSVYYGNFLNTLFGIKQQCSIDYENGNINDDLRLDSDLGSRYSNVQLIDGGRYV